MLKPAAVAVLMTSFTSIGAFAQVPTPKTVATRTFDLVYEADVRGIPAESERVEIWVPIPQDDAHQDVIDLRIEAPHPWKIHTDPEYGNSVLHVALTDLDTQSVSLALHVRIKRREHRRPIEPVANPEPFDGRWLMPDRLVPLDDFVTKLALEVTEGAETQLERARAIYDYVVDTMVYDKSGTGWGKGDIYWACDALTGNCTDFHALFIGLNRAVGIPATFEIGFPLPADRTSGQIEGYHCWAQFYVEGIGWIPVDTSEANRRQEQREYFFGAHDVHRILFSKGRDITLQPPQQGPPLNYFIYPYVEVDGTPFDDVDLRFSFNDLKVTAGTATQ